jgi:hypothetical protein
MNKAFLETILCYNSEDARLYWVNSQQRPDRIGKPAGWLDDSTGYWKITILGVTYLASKIIWCLVYDEWLENNPDHKDLDRSNDHLNNLRKTNKSLNAANTGIRLDNTTGFKGVSKKGNKFAAYIQINGKSIYLGIYLTPEKAHEVYMTRAVEAFGEFARAR